MLSNWRSMANTALFAKRTVLRQPRSEEIFRVARSVHLQTALCVLSLHNAECAVLGLPLQSSIQSLLCFRRPVRSTQRIQGYPSVIVTRLTASYYHTVGRLGPDAEWVLVPLEALT